MAQTLAELCNILVENAYGEVSATIFSTLAEHGRLTILTLAHYTHIPPRRLRQCLGTLLAQQLLQRYAPEDGGPAYYSVDWRVAYNVARRNNMMDLVRARYGKEASRLVGNILEVGYARVGDLVKAYERTSGAKRDAGMGSTAPRLELTTLLNGHKDVNRHVLTNGLAPDDLSVSQLHATLRQLLRDGILVKVSARGYMPAADLLEQVEEAIISEQFPDGKVSGPKKQNEFKMAVNKRKRKWTEDDEYSDVRDLDSRGIINGSGVPSSKRVKVDCNLTNGHGQDAGSASAAVKLSSDLILRVDHAKCTLALRSQRLQLLAKRMLGPTTALVYGALLRCLESKCRGLPDVTIYEDADDEDEAQPTVNITSVADMLDSHLNVTLGIKGLSSAPKLSNGDKRSKKELRIIEEDDFADLGIKREVQSDSDNDAMPNGFVSYRDKTKRISNIEAHLSLLEEHRLQFCTRVHTHGGHNEWRVDFPNMNVTLLNVEFDNVVEARCGPVALRIFRILRQFGKLDEKQISLKGMTHIKEVRALLTRLQFQGLVESQELPKDNSRQPTKALYLAFVDDNIVRSNLLQQTYKAMSRALQRMRAQRATYAGVMEKADREDVKGQEQTKLEPAEKQALRSWREIEERILSQVSRLDELVAVLRDFDGKDAALTS